MRRHFALEVETERIDPSRVQQLLIGMGNRDGSVNLLARDPEGIAKLDVRKGYGRQLTAC